MKLFRVARERWLPLLPDPTALQARAQPQSKDPRSAGEVPQAQLLEETGDSKRGFEVSGKAQKR